MIRTLLAALLAATVALAQPAPQRPPLDEMFNALREAPSDEAAAPIEARIRHTLLTGASPAVTLLMRRGLRNMQAGAMSEALEDFDAALDLAPDLAEGWHLRASVLVHAGDLDGAARAVQQALAREARHFAALVTLSRIAEARGDLAAAIRAQQAALAIHPRLPGGTQRLNELRRLLEGEAT